MLLVPVEDARQGQVIVESLQRQLRANGVHADFLRRLANA